MANISNPKVAINTFLRVIKWGKPSSSAFCAGINSGQILEGPIDKLSKGRILIMMVWAPKGNIKVRMR
ncbi:hypothetical protein [Flavobacterium sp. ACAM 123]|uniref:hypothetical protein n=1 Tax=Flavobacterium sp. ACAM 123 TaxID=1189620 RepID=UPI0002EA25B5|nr:hypothetical protein [Flavobacterium sp. ACAM 123]